ncbi:MAG: L-fucose/L-arabinose isomerase family protein [Anaerolineae bacterium]
MVKPISLGVILGNRDFFPDHLVDEARRDITALFQTLGIESIMLPPDAPKLGSVETYEHARACADLFDARRASIDGILVVLPNFGDEKGIAEAVKLSGLRVPILVQAYPDQGSALSVEQRRDAFCGKISVCNNLRQYGYDFSITSAHTSHPLSDSFRADLLRFCAVCRVVKGLSRLRVGAIGARPNGFNTVRYSEKLLQAAGISVCTADLSELLGQAARLADDDPQVNCKLNEIRTYAPSQTVPSAALAKMARLGTALDAWMETNAVQATAIECWSSLQANFGVNACTLMSMLSEHLMPSACEVDVTGAITMAALQLASGTPAALADWNNNYEDDPDRCVFFHCVNWPRSFSPGMSIATAPILGTTLGEHNTFGALEGRAPAMPITYARLTTDDRRGLIAAYTGQGELTADPLDTFGQRAVVHVPGLPRLLAFICKNGFEHHVALTQGSVADILLEAFSTYLHWETYQHPD